MKTVDKSRSGKQVQIRLDSIGWKSLLQRRGGTSRILVLKTVVNGLGLERAQPVYSYVGEDQDGRPVMISYLDRKARIPAEGGEGEQGEPGLGPVPKKSH